MKRILILSLALFFCFSVSACSGSKTSEADAGDMCYVTIDCHTALSSPDLSPDKKEVLPENGMILSKAPVAISKDMTVLSAVQKACKDAKVPIAVKTTSWTFIDAVSGLSTADAGDLSGWLFCYNGQMPEVSIKDLKAEKDAEILIVYTCDMGSDVGLMH